MVNVGCFEFLVRVCGMNTGRQQRLDIYMSLTREGKNLQVTGCSSKSGAM